MSQNLSSAAVVIGALRINFLPLLSALLSEYFLNAYIKNNMNPDQTAPLGAHSVCICYQKKLSKADNI